MLWYVWLLIAALFVLPVVAAFIDGRDPDNAIRHESGDGSAEDPDEMLAAA